MSNLKFIQLFTKVQWEIYFLNTSVYRKYNLIVQLFNFYNYRLIAIELLGCLFYKLQVKIKVNDPGLLRTENVYMRILRYLSLAALQC